MQSETRVRVGTVRLYEGGASNSLETTSSLYTAEGTSIGLVTANSFDLGELSSIGFEHVPTFETFEAANVLTSSLEVLSEEETTISMGLTQFDARILELAVGTGSIVTVGDERLIKVGGQCSAPRRPIEIAAENIGCNAPAATVDVLTGVSAIVITAYDCQCTSGLPLSELVAGELVTYDLEWGVKPVATHALGNKLFNMLVF
jgi:hypothetical protein